MKLQANTDRRRYDAIPTGNEPVGYRVKVKTAKEVSNDLQVPREDSVTAAADGNDEFLSLGSEDEDEDDDEDTGCMIRETNKESPLTKVKGLTVCRTLAVILAWLLAVSLVICPYVCLSACMSVCVSVWLSVCLFDYLNYFLPLCLYVSITCCVYACMYV